MDKGQSPLFAELTLGADTQEFTPNPIKRFSGTGSEPQQRALNALLVRPCKRESVDRIAGVSNGPDLIGRLRDRGLTIPCTMTPGLTRDGKKVDYGVYWLTSCDRRKVRVWQRKNKVGVTQRKRKEAK